MKKKMQFQLQNGTVTLIVDQTTYTIPTEDVARLVMRPGTRVLRFTKEGEVSSIPLTTAVGEIEGFELLKQL